MSEKNYKRVRVILELLDQGLTQDKVANFLGTSRQNVSVLLRPPPSIRRRIYSRSKNRCEICSNSLTNSWSYHHLWYRPTLQYTAEDFLVTCCSCHTGDHKNGYPTLVDLEDTFGRLLTLDEIRVVRL